MLRFIITDPALYNAVIHVVIISEDKSQNHHCKKQEHIMARQARIISETGIYHIIQRGADRRLLFSDEYDYMKFLSILPGFPKQHITMDLGLLLSYLAEIFPDNLEQFRQIQDTADCNDNGYDTERTVFLALSALYSFDPYDIQDDRKADDPECISGQNKDNYSF
ncbi:MAG: hypothetical protein K6F28_06025 [Lachnospiraceae bacterium]|nr:hypothetical protein [Lachnospiraceae bacterium]